MQSFGVVGAATVVVVVLGVADAVAVGVADTVVVDRDVVVGLGEVVVGVETVVLEDSAGGAASFPARQPVRITVMKRAGTVRRIGTRLPATGTRR